MWRATPKMTMIMLSDHDVIISMLILMIITITMMTITQGHDNKCCNKLARRSIHFIFGARLWPD